MRLVRRHRSKILLILGLLALGSMTWGYLQRIGVVHDRPPSAETREARDAIPPHPVPAPPKPDVPAKPPASDPTTQLTSWAELGTWLSQASELRVHRLGAGEPAPGEGEIAGHRIVATTVPDESWFRSFRDLLLKEPVLPRSAKRCIFAPGLAVQAVQGDEELVISLCFSCDELTIEGAGYRSGLLDFDDRSRALLRLGRRLFDDDRQLAPVPAKPSGEEDVVDPWAQ